jgi:hypothetical protein
MLNISEIDSYRDGGTISIKCFMAISWKEVPYLEMHRNQEIQICIDRRFGKEPLLWFGYPERYIGNELSVLIEDQSIIDYIIKKVDEYKTRQNNKLDNFINYRENIRDWKIKNILE